MYATAVKRGCGKRQKGGVYVEVGLAGPGEDGVPLESFLVDPPLPVDLKAMGLTPVAVKMVERDGIWHVFDFVGEKYYPNIADFLEEVRRFGLSRRLPKNIDYSLLTSESKIILVHRKAWIENVRPYYEDWQTLTEMYWNKCPNSDQSHADDYDEMCAGVWWQDIDPHEHKKVPYSGSDRIVEIEMPSFKYTAALKPDDHLPGYDPAIFASFPMHRLAVVDDPEGKTHLDALKAASDAGIPTDLVDA